MPVYTKKIKNKWRVVEGQNGRITTNKAGTAVDGGGHKTQQAAMKQAQAINAN